MKPLFCLILLCGVSASATSQTKEKLTLKQVLLNQLKTTHNKEEWFAPLNVAIDGLTADQANWKEKGADHSIAQLTTHIIFWNQDQLSKFLNQPEPKFSGDNNETFKSVDNNSWPATVKKADSVMINWENALKLRMKKNWKPGMRLSLISAHIMLITRVRLSISGKYKGRGIRHGA